MRAGRRLADPQKQHLGSDHVLALPSYCQLDLHGCCCRRWCSLLKTPVSTWLMFVGVMELPSAAMSYIALMSGDQPILRQRASGDVVCTSLIQSKSLGICKIRYRCSGYVDRRSSAQCQKLQGHPHTILFLTMRAFSCFKEKSGREKQDC